MSCLKKMDSKKKNVVDVSCFFIFEATGDSEVDQFDDPNKATGITKVQDDGNDVNDAESCSHDDDDEDSSDDNFPFVSSKNNNQGSFYDNVHVCIHGDKEEEGEEAHSHYPTWPREPHNNNNNEHKNSSQEKLLSEMEKNKLFWETCLAS